MGSISSVGHAPVMIANAKVGKNFDMVKFLMLTIVKHLKVSPTPYIYYQSKVAENPPSEAMVYSYHIR